ncbi:BTAD domain-containing putative transcriptional regulator [Streptomyces purpureus]|uniref:OmpR/PhoB-type domain-containing protein n=1 Tax=Streptomyces purpureus TaxID=1951 RepID=A0A918GY03_9ACTN|nr:BTAD domain-containing putative transcriptional regulator [Streptomyces purpureus]GGT20487.1 hypothetical protein GCM10014713_11600 [Streptomyces purpureus]
MRYGVLGTLAVWDAAGEPVRVAEPKVRALLAALLLHEGRPVSADRLLDDLWGEDLPGRPANALQAKVSQLRRALGRDRVVHGPTGYRLLLAEDELDATGFRALLARARHTPDPAPRAALLGEALALWRGAAYEDVADEPFVREGARRLEEERLTALEDLAEARLALGEHATLAPELTALVARHPLRERLRATQLRALTGAGRQADALHSYEDLRTRLAEELGVDPGPELAALHTAILRGDLPPDDPAGPAAGPAVPVPAPRPAALPTPLTRLVGRERDVEATARLLREARLVTLVGAGGVGKTRLAVETAYEAAYDDGVWFVELAGHGRGADLAETVAAALGVRDDAAGPLSPGTPVAAAERLAAALRGRDALLVLDNCEHVVAEAAELTVHLLRTAPGLRVLATSQEPLGLPGETVWPVEPLAPEDAVRLFAARATAADPGFTLGPGTTDDVAEICRRLDGIPLALELAATRVRALGTRALAARLGDRFRLLTNGQRGAPPRQQTLRAMIDWSWELLSVPERIVLRRLAVHRDGCTLGAAEAVCGGDGVPREDVVELLSRLVDRSLVVRSGERYRLLESVAAYALERLRDVADEDAVRARHRAFYLSLAEAAGEGLRGGGVGEGGLRGGDLRAEGLGSGARHDGGQRSEARLDGCPLDGGQRGEARLDGGRLDGCPLDGALRGEARLDGARHDGARLDGGQCDGGQCDDGQHGWLRRLDAEAANLRAAAEPDPGPFAVALAWYWLLSGRLREGRRWFARAASEPGASGEVRAMEAAFALLCGEKTALAPEVYATIEDPAARARARWLVAYGHYYTGDLAESERLVAAVAEPAAAADRWTQAAAHALRSAQALLRGDVAAQGRHGHEAVRIFRELGDKWGELQAVAPLAALAEINGDYGQATRRHEDGLRLAQDLGLAAQVSARLSGLGRLALLAGDWDRAAELHGRALRTAAEHGNKWGEIYAEMGLALGARRAGQLEEAERLLHRIADWYARVSSEQGNHLILAELGFVAELRGDGPAARALHLRSLAVARAVGDPRARALALEGLAGAEVLTGRPTRALLLLRTAAALRGSASAPLPPAERTDVTRITAAAQAALEAAGIRDPQAPH